MLPSPGQASVVGVDCRHDVGENAARVALPTSPTGRAWAGWKNGFAVPDRQHVPAGDRRAGLLAPALDQPFDRHLFVGQEMTVPDLGGAAAAGQFSQAQGLARDDRIEKLSPLYRGEDRENGLTTK